MVSNKLEVMVDFASKFIHEVVWASGLIWLLDNLMFLGIMQAFSFGSQVQDERYRYRALLGI